MADKIGLLSQQDVPVKWVDNHDGSFAPQLGITVGDITIGTVTQGNAGSDPWLIEGSITNTPSGSTLGTGGTGTAAAVAAAIGGSQACQSVLLTNTHSSLTLKFGNAGAQVVPLNPGAFVSLPCTNVNEVYVIDGTGHATFAYIPVIAA